MEIFNIIIHVYLQQFSDDLCCIDYANFQNLQTESNDIECQMSKKCFFIFLAWAKGVIDVVDAMLRRL